MKKVLILLTVYLVIVSLLGSCIAENGLVTVGKEKITLGMKKDEVEKQTGAKPIQTNYDWNWKIWNVLNSENDLFDNEATDDIPGNFLYLNTSFAGFDNSRILYSFDENDILTSIVIIIHASNLLSFGPVSISVGDENFRLLRDALTKYGSPVAEGEKYIDFKTGYYDALSALKSRGFSGRSVGVSWFGDYSTEITNSAQWLVESGEYYTDIKLIEVHRKEKHRTGLGTLMVKTTENVDNYGVLLSYTTCSKEQVDDYIKDVQTRQESLNSDI